MLRFSGIGNWLANPLLMQIRNLRYINVRYLEPRASDLQNQDQRPFYCEINIHDVGSHTQSLNQVSHGKDNPDCWTSSPEKRDWPLTQARMIIHCWLRPEPAVTVRSPEGSLLNPNSEICSSVYLVFHLQSSSGFHFLKSSLKTHSLYLCLPSVRVTWQTWPLLVNQLCGLI